jgi:hypothetical protein
MGYSLDLTCSVRYEMRFHVPEDGILHSYRRENLRSYIMKQHFSDVPVGSTIGFLCLHITRQHYCRRSSFQTVSSFTTCQRQRKGQILHISGLILVPHEKAVNIGMMDVLFAIP